MIFRIYNSILVLDCQSSSRIEKPRERELRIQLSKELWELAMNRIWSVTTCACLGPIHFKVLHRVHFSKTRLSEMYLEEEDKCDNRRGSPRHLSHMLFFLVYLLYCNVPCSWCKSEALTLNFYIWGPWPLTCTKLWTKRYSFHIFTRRSSLLHWKSPKFPSVSQWLKDTVYFLRFDIKYTLREDFPLMATIYLFPKTQGNCPFDCVP